MVLKEISARLQEVDYRRAFGSEMAKYDLAFALVDARRSQGLTQQRLATLTGVSQAYIAKLESGEANPTIGHVGAIIAAMWLRPKFKLEPLVSTDAPTYSAVTVVTSPSEHRARSPSGTGGDVMYLFLARAIVVLVPTALAVYLPWVLFA